MLKRVVSVIILIAERGLAFRGDNQLVGSRLNGNFLGILELLAQYDNFLAGHIATHANRGRGHTHYLSSTIMEALVHTMGEKVLGEIISRVKKSKYYSISLDSTPDAAHTDQINLVLRYMERDGPVERFVTFMANKGQRAQDMFDALMEFLDSHCLDIRNCRGQSYDNASAMRGKYNGLQAKVREKNSFASWIPCTAHSLNLVGKNAVECCSSAIYYFDFVEKLFNFFTMSTHRHQLLTEALRHDSSLLTLKRVTTTRWSCRADATKALKHGYQHIKDVLARIVDDNQEKGCVRCEAEGLWKRISRLETGIYTVFWNDILQRTDATNKSSQHAKLDLNSAVVSLTSLQNYVASKRDSFDTYEQQGKELSGSTNYDNPRKTRLTHHSVRPDQLDSSHAEGVQRSPSSIYKKESFLPVIDQFIASLDQRLQAYKHISSQFSFFRHLRKMHSNEIRAAAERLIRFYPDDLDVEFIAEMTQFAEFANVFIGEDPEDISIELFLYRLIMDKGVHDTFPNVEIALRIYLVLMVSNCSGERSFSKLKLIENRMRTSMKQERLVNLTIMSIESDILHELDFADIISDFAKRKPRKLSGL